jgi:hypothetical protein
MNGDDIDWKDLVDYAWSQVIADTKARKVCLYPGPDGDTTDFEDFVECLPMIGGCDTLVYAEPRLGRIQAWERIKWHKDNLQFLIHGLGFVTDIEMVTPPDLPEPAHRALFGQPGPEWIPAEAQPPDDRFWMLYSRWTIGERKVHLLVIGLTGNAAWVYFLQSHGIQPVRIIASPPWGPNHQP